MRLGIENEKAARSLANPLHQPPIIGAIQQCLDSVQGIRAAAGRSGWALSRLSPFIDH